MSTPSGNRLVEQWGAGRRIRGPSWARRIWVAAALVLVVALGVTIWLALRPHAWRPQSGAPHFVSCTYGGYVSGWCANLAVPEDPAKPRGPTIELHLAVLPATTRHSAGALFYLEGGPGVAATRSAVEVNELFAEVGRYRDIVMVDERGTGGSAPLACAGERVPADDATAVTAYLRRCFARLPAGVRLDTTSVAADDLDAVRRALGYGKIDLYGVSYGATLAQEFIRRHPAAVRSVVLDGGALPDVKVYDLSARNAELALDGVLARCGRSPACHREYPETRRQLDELLGRPPRRVSLESGPVVVRPDDVAWTVAALSETADAAATIPYAVDAAAHGDYTPLARAFHDDLGADLDARARLASFWVILCSEPWAAFDPAATARDGAGSYLVHAAVARARLFRRACGVVPTGRVPADAGRPATTRAPVLLLVGGNDPLDPIGSLRGWRRAFPDGRVVVVPGTGHGAIRYACIQTLVARFVAAGSARGLDASCARHVPLPPFETG
ncbi:MAG TPA: alpha/beta hydrolase [Gaiellaceae bacterium]|nr:alpha/beta hydrolase [Gaiellaceae bacterium]